MKIEDNIQRCFYCKRSFIEENYGTNKSCAKTRDHIIPLSKGGSNRPINMVYACCECNHAKSDLSLQQFIDKINEHIVSRKRIKTITPKLLPEIIKNSRILIQYVEQKGEKLYASHKPEVKERQFRFDLRESNFPTIAEINREVKKAKKVYPKSIRNIGADAHLSVNTNTPRSSTAAMVARLLSDPRTKF